MSPWFALPSPTPKTERGRTAQTGRPRWSRVQSQPHQVPPSNQDAQSLRRFLAPGTRASTQTITHPSAGNVLIPHALKKPLIRNQNRLPPRLITHPLPFPTGEIPARRERGHASARFHTPGAGERVLPPGATKQSRRAGTAWCRMTRTLRFSNGAVVVPPPWAARPRFISHSTTNSPPPRAPPPPTLRIFQYPRRPDATTFEAHRPPMTKVPPQPTPELTPVCPECGRTPAVQISWCASRTAPWLSVLLAALLSLAVTLRETRSSVIVINSLQMPARLNMSVMPGCYIPSDLRAMADGTADAAAFMSDLRRYIKVHTKNDATPGRRVHIGLGGPEGEQTLTWKVGWPWTFYTAGQTSNVADVRTGASQPKPPPINGLVAMSVSVRPTITAQRLQWQSASKLRSIEFAGVASTLLLLFVAWHASRSLAVRMGRASRSTPAALVVILILVMAAMALLQSRDPSDTRRKVAGTPFASVPRVPMPPRGMPANDAVIDLDELVQTTHHSSSDNGQKAAALMWRQVRSLGWDSPQYICLAVSAANPRTATLVSSGAPLPMALLVSEMGEPLPPRSLLVELSPSALVLQLPRKAQGTDSTEIVVHLDSVFYGILLCYTLFQLTRFTQYLLFTRRLHHRQKHNLCPHCAYPIPTPAHP